MGIQKQFGCQSIENLEFQSLLDRYVVRRYLSKLKHIRILNYIDYNISNAISELSDYCGFQYYGGKHYESILTRFLQCYYLPVKFNIDKRKSHYSSLIVSEQMYREEALALLEKPLYSSESLLMSDKKTLAEYIGVTVERLDEYIAQPPKYELDYPHSLLNELAPLARKLRTYLD